jgi:hypothetical protein
MKSSTREGQGAFSDYMGDRVEGSLFWKLTTSLEVEKLDVGPWTCIRVWVRWDLSEGHQDSDL